MSSALLATIKCAVPYQAETYTAIIEATIKSLYILNQ
jgi:hypothetical protein